MNNVKEIEHIILGKTYKNGKLERTVSKIDGYQIYYIDKKGNEKSCWITTFQDWIRAGEKNAEEQNKKTITLSCWICETTMELVKTKNIQMLGTCEVFRCNKCGEKVYHPIKNK